MKNMLAQSFHFVRSFGIIFVHIIIMHRFPMCKSHEPERNLNMLSGYK